MSDVYSGIYGNTDTDYGRPLDSSDVLDFCGDATGTVRELPHGVWERMARDFGATGDVTLDLDAGSPILGAASGYDAPEPNPYDQYQDYGHRHFHDAIIWGDGLHNIGFAGQGTIDGGGHLITGTPKPGQADKIISLTRCSGRTVDGITLRQGGHFAMLINGCDGVTSDHLAIDTASDRDGWNVINTQNVKITNITASSNDDEIFQKQFPAGQVALGPDADTADTANSASMYVVTVS